MNRMSIRVPGFSSRFDGREWNIVVQGMHWDDNAGLFSKVIARVIVIAKV